MAWCGAAVLMSGLWDIRLCIADSGRGTTEVEVLDLSTLSLSPVEMRPVASTGDWLAVLQRWSVLPNVRKSFQGPAQTHSSRGACTLGTARDASSPSRFWALPSRGNGLGVLSGSTLRRVSSRASCVGFPVLALRLFPTTSRCTACLAPAALARAGARILWFDLLVTSPASAFDRGRHRAPGRG